MNKLEESKHYGIVDEIITNEGSGVGNLSVSAMRGASENYPEARIVIGSTTAAGVDGVDGFAISVTKWRELEALVNQACRDITAACPAHGDPAPQPVDGQTRPQRLRSYLQGRWRKIREEVSSLPMMKPDRAAGRQTLLDEATSITEFLVWMDEAGLGK